MSVLVKGMEMPKSCHNCELSAKVNLEYGNGYFCQMLAEMIANTHERKANCPLVEIPPHGRLIDADMMEKECCHGCKNEFHKYENCIDCVLANAPTIIPADVPDNNVGNIPAEGGEA